VRALDNSANEHIGALLAPRLALQVTGFSGGSQRNGKATEL